MHAFGVNDAILFVNLMMMEYSGFALTLDLNEARRGI